MFVSIKFIRKTFCIVGTEIHMKILGTECLKQAPSKKIIDNFWNHFGKDNVSESIAP